MPRLGKCLFLCLAIAANLILYTGPAGAHALLVRSTPSHGATLDRAPSVVEVSFNEPIVAEFTPLMVRDQVGVRKDAGDAHVNPLDRTMVSVSLKPLPAGLYTVVYRVTSLDGHPVQGTIAFSVGAFEASYSASDAATPATIDPAVLVSPLHGAVLWLAVVLAGLTAFLVLVWWPVAGIGHVHLRRWSILLASLLLATGLAEVGLYAVRASGEPFSAALLGQAFTRTRVGLLWLVRDGLVLLSALALTFSPKLRPGLVRGLTVLPGFALLLTLSIQSHAMATQKLLPVVADWLHLVAAASWVGGLVGFASVVRPYLKNKSTQERERILGRAVPRFSRVAVISVLLLAATGIYGSLLHIPSWEALLSTTYGKALLVKLGLFLPVLGLGGYNLAYKGRGPFHRLVWGEVILVLGIFVVVGFLTSLPPAKVELAARQGPYIQTVDHEGHKIELRIDPNRVGFNSPLISLIRADGTPERGAGVGLRVSMATHDMGLQNLDAMEQTPGVYKAEQLIFGMDGEWQVEVVALTKQGREVRYPFEVTVPPPVLP